MANPGITRLTNPTTSAYERHQHALRRILTLSFNNRNCIQANRFEKARKITWTINRQLQPPNTHINYTNSAVHIHQSSLFKSVQALQRDQLWHGQEIDWRYDNTKQMVTTVILSRQQSVTISTPKTGLAFRSVNQ
jgi:leucyl aminopeptidase (aminopeptidase T)